MDPIADKLLVDSLLIFYALPINQEAFGFVGKTGIPLVFVVIMIDQIKKIKNKYLPFIGIITTTICLLIFKDNF